MPAEITRGCGKQHTGRCPAENPLPEPPPQLSGIIMRLEKLDVVRKLAGTDPQITARHLTDAANDLYRLATLVRRGET